MRVLFVALTLNACLSTRGAGVTVMTHGFNGNVTDWVIPMLGHVPNYPGFPGTNFSCYSITIRRSSGNIVASRTLLGGSGPLGTDSGEILVKLDWSSLAGLFSGASSTEVAGAAANALLSTTLFPELGGRALAELPLHLIGHSRGGSVVSEMGRFLGAQGVWVDHVTLLDPHPVAEFGDAAVRTWENVLFADDYWQMNSDFTCPNGESALGAYNRFLANLSGAYSCPHSDVHLWYHGTIDATTPTGDSDEDITASERQSWWTLAEAAGAQAGFRYSRIGGGNRFSTAEPAGQGTGRIRDGYNQIWDFGAGSSANRYVLPANNGMWPNIIQLNITGTNRVAPGESSAVRFFYQSGANTNQSANVRFSFDVDSNPFNSNQVQIASYTYPNTGIDDVYYDDVTLTAPTNMPAGNYRVHAEIILGTKKRYLYAPGMVMVAANAEPPRFASVRRTAGQIELMVEARVGQRVILQRSQDFSNWTSMATNIVTVNPFSFIDPAASQSRRFYRAVVAP